MTATAQARGKTTSEGIMSLLPIISREEARQKGLKRFFTGKPCKHGHVCERRVDSSECAECGRTRGRAYHRRPDVKERVQAHRQQPDVKERIQERVRAWAQRPEVRERRRAYHRWSEVKERKRRPEVRAQQRAYQQRPDVKERRQRPEVKERRLAYLRIWRQRPDVKERIRAYSQRRGLAYRGNGGGDAAVRDQRAAPGARHPGGQGDKFKVLTCVQDGASNLVVRENRESRSRKW
jgi:hypothetical protein